MYPLTSQHNKTKQSLTNLFQLQQQKHLKTETFSIHKTLIDNREQFQHDLKRRINQKKTPKDHNFLDTQNPN